MENLKTEVRKPGKPEATFFTEFEQPYLSAERETVDSINL